MGSYYYILASLPALLPEGPLPFDHSTFMELCRPWLDARALEQLGRARIEVDGPPPDEARLTALTRIWACFENDLRNALALARANAQGLPPGDHLKPESTPWFHTQPLVDEAIKAKDPLSAELHLLQVRWRFLTDLEVGHEFDLEALVVYSLKLQLLERRRRFDNETGKKALDELLGRLRLNQLPDIPLESPAS